MHGWDLLNSILGRRARRSSFDRFPAGYANHSLCISNGFQHVSTDKGQKETARRASRAGSAELGLFEPLCWSRLAWPLRFEVLRSPVRSGPVTEIQHLVTEI